MWDGDVDGYGVGLLSRAGFVGAPSSEMVEPV